MSVLSSSGGKPSCPLETCKIAIKGFAPDQEKANQVIAYKEWQKEIEREAAAKKAASETHADTPKTTVKVRNVSR